MDFTEEEVTIAKQTREAVINGDSDAMKAVYMAGEICMWDELQTEKRNTLICQS